MTDAVQPAPLVESSLVVQASTSLRRLLPCLLAIAAALIFTAVATLRWDHWIGAMAVQSTNDAYIRAQTTQLSARVAAAVKSVEVEDFQRVRAGDLLLQIDPADYLAQAAQAEAAVAAAQAALANLANQVELQNATIAEAEAQQVAAAALALQAQQEQGRQQSLMQTQSGTLQRLQQAIAAYDKSRADVKASEAAVSAQRQQLAVLAGTRQQRAADLQGAKAALDAARLRLGYTRIIAPFDGVVSERQVQVGDYVNVGTNLVSVVPLPDVYVIANYKETQLRRVRPGQRVDIEVDTFAGQVLSGTVQRISPASGAQFALLPPDNATGNFTKVVQRVAVRIAFDKGQPLLDRLLPGMSVTTRIHVDGTRVGTDDSE
jgi:membrane fusion protein (multidrug efflux system)